MVDYFDTCNSHRQTQDAMAESFSDNFAPLARQILSTCGPGRILDVGSGLGSLVRELLNQGADAYSIDISSPTATHCNSYTPGRFFTGSILELPFPDESFDTLVSTDCLEHFAPEDVAIALKEMRRVCRYNLFLCVATGPARNSHRITEKRGWWEDAAFLAGFRKHPNYYTITPFHALEVEAGTITIPLEKIPDSVISQCPLSKLLEQRELHMDMSRETGRRSDAHMARYHLAVNYIRDGDTVLDSACGMGYGSQMLARQSSAAQVIGADLDSDAVLYAANNFVCKRLSFRSADVQNLEFLPDNSIDLFVSFETLEHVPFPERLIAEAKRILRPGGRFIVSVPNLWVNEEGVDPNPHHLHVYDWARLAKEVKANFMLEAAYAQIAGGGMKLSSHPRSLLEFSPEGELPKEAEWWLAVGMKDPLESKAVHYNETALHWDGEPPNAVAFARDYENPWLIRSMVSIGWRNRNAIQRAELARRTLADSPRDSADAGSALCVLAYGLLESLDQLTPASVLAIVEEINAYIDIGGSSPQYHRWVISLLYVRGLLWQSVGDLERSLESFMNCASADPLIYSPLLASKTVDACRLAGVIQFQMGNRDEAQTLWSLGISRAEHALRGDWREIHGDVEQPFTFGLREAAQVLDIASRCADGIHHLRVNDPLRGLPDDGSFMVRLDASGQLVQKNLNELAELRASPYLRLKNALQDDPRSFRRIARVFYLLAIILLPAKLKIKFRPLANRLRRGFE